MRLPGSLRARIALAAVAAVGVCGVLAGVLLLAAVERDGRNQIDAELRERADSILRRGDAYGRRHGGREPLLRGSGTFAQVAYGDEVPTRRATSPTTRRRARGRGLRDDRHRRRAVALADDHGGTSATRGCRSSARSRRSTSASTASAGSCCCSACPRSR